MSQLEMVYFYNSIMIEATNRYPHSESLPLPATAVDNRLEKEITSTIKYGMLRRIRCHRLSIQLASLISPASSPSHSSYYHRSRRFRPTVREQLVPKRHPNLLFVKNHVVGL